MSRYIKRLVWEKLLKKSNNKCAFPGCNQVIVTDNNVMIGQMAHIEAYNCGGPRYNPSLTEEQKNSIDNLIYLCPTHHTIIDKNESTYTVDIIKKMKNEHESNNCGERYTFDYNRIYEKNIELQLYLEDLEEENKKNITELRVPIVHEDSFEGFVEDTYRLIEWINEKKDENMQFITELNEKIIEQMEEIGMDSTRWKEIPYYENKFYMPMWETYCIGYENTIINMKMNLKLMEIFYYTEYLKCSVDNTIKQKLDKIKEEIMKLAPKIVYFD